MSSSGLNHHLTCNRGFWWVCCSINATSKTKEKISFSLQTKDPTIARLRRDVFLNELHREGLEVRIRASSRINLGPVSVVSPKRRLIPWEIRVEAARRLTLATDPTDESSNVDPPFLPRYLHINSEDGAVFWTDNPPTSEELSYAGVGLRTIIRLTDLHTYGVSRRWRKIEQAVLTRTNREDGVLNPSIHIHPLASV